MEKEERGGATGRWQLGHVNHQAASTLVAVLLPGKGSRRRPVDADEFNVALPALITCRQVFRSEFVQYDTQFISNSEQQAERQRTLAHRL